MYLGVSEEMKILINNNSFPQVEIELTTVALETIGKSVLGLVGTRTIQNPLPSMNSYSIGTVAGIAVSIDS